MDWLFHSQTGKMNHISLIQNLDAVSLELQITFYKSSFCPIGTISKWGQIGSKGIYDQKVNNHGKVVPNLLTGSI